MCRGGAILKSWGCATAGGGKKGTGWPRQRGKVKGLLLRLCGANGGLTWSVEGEIQVWKEKGVVSY